MRNVFRSLCLFLATSAPCLLAVFGGKLIVDRRGASAAAISQAKAETTRADWLMADQLRAESDRGELRNDRLAVHNAQLDVEIAQLEGRSTAAANAKLHKYQELVRIGENLAEITQFSAALGPDQHIRESEQQIDAAAASQTHYRFGIKHDQWGLAAGIGLTFLAVACAFAWRSAPIIA